jgi:hypothetical protein
LLVLTLVLAQLLALGRSQALRSAQGQLMEDAQLALELLRRDFMMLGYGRPLQAQASGPAYSPYRSQGGGKPPFSDAHGSGMSIGVGPFGAYVGFNVGNF